ncbi:MAG: dTDP-4-dehydrorhamnose reductase [bacterium]|nr:dTDP-4-dehydrorhamnose reductase [bacterium]
MRIAIIGADGQLGSDLVRVFQDENIISLTEKDIDILEKDKLKSVISPLSPHLIINTAALSNVPLCEKDPEKAFKINAIGARNVATTAKEIKSSLLYISTDYVFDGEKNKPYLEDDLPGPLNTYGLSKLAGEYYTRYITDKYFIIRTSGLYGIHKCITKGTNFVDKMLAYKNGDEVRMVTDEILTPTYTLHLAQQIYELVKTNTYGVYHITSEGECSWYEFAKNIFSFVGLDVKLVRITSNEFPSEVIRPKYSVLENRNLKALGISNMPHWRDSLKAYLTKKGY